MTDKCFNALRKIAAAVTKEFPDMPNGPWSNLTAGQQADIVNQQAAENAKKKTPPKAPQPKKKQPDIKDIHRQIDRDHSIPPENKEAEKNAATEQWNQEHFR